MISGTAPVSLGDLQAGVEQRLDGVRGEIRRLIEADFPLIALVNSHLTQMQGKMFRPTLLLLSEAATTPEPQPRAVSLAAVVELIHLATLVHDDAVDHSVLRRGMPTINALFSHQVAVIMGDFLYARALTELVRLGDWDVARVFADASTTMTLGEMRQLGAIDALALDRKSVV